MSLGSTKCFHLYDIVFSFQKLQSMLLSKAPVFLHQWRRMENKESSIKLPGLSESKVQEPTSIIEYCAQYSILFLQCFADNKLTLVEDVFIFCGFNERQKSRDPCAVSIVVIVSNGCNEQPSSCQPASAETLWVFFSAGQCRDARVFRKSHLKARSRSCSRVRPRGRRPVDTS